MEGWAAWWIGLLLCIALFLLIGAAAFMEETRFGRHVSDRLLAWFERRWDR